MRGSETIAFRMCFGGGNETIEDVAVDFWGEGESKLMNFVELPFRERNARSTFSFLTLMRSS